MNADVSPLNRLTNHHLQTLVETVVSQPNVRINLQFFDELRSCVASIVHGIARPLQTMTTIFATTHLTSNHVVSVLDEVPLRVSKEACMLPMHITSAYMSIAFPDIEFTEQATVLVQQTIEHYLGKIVRDAFKNMQTARRKTLEPRDLCLSPVVRASDIRWMKSMVNFEEWLSGRGNTDQLSNFINLLIHELSRLTMMFHGWLKGGKEVWGKALECAVRQIASDEFASKLLIHRTVSPVLSKLLKKVETLGSWSPYAMTFLGMIIENIVDEWSASDDVRYNEELVAVMERLRVYI